MKNANKLIKPFADMPRAEKVRAIRQQAGRQQFQINRALWVLSAAAAGMFAILAFGLAAWR